MKRVTFVLVLTAMVLGACAPAPPKIDPAQIQGSAVAAASTMIALTKAAIPTSTPIPPTPLPSPTPHPLPTLPVQPTLAGLASPTSASETNCAGPLDLASSGPKTTLVIRNEARAPITFSLGITTKNTFGQCGWLSWAMGKGQAISAQIPLVHTNLGDTCYQVVVFVNDPKKPNTIYGNGSYCIDSTAKWEFDVSPVNVKLIPP